MLGVPGDCQIEAAARLAAVELRELLRKELLDSSQGVGTEGVDDAERSYWSILGLRIAENLQVFVILILRPYHTQSTITLYTSWVENI